MFIFPPPPMHIFQVHMEHALRAVCMQLPPSCLSASVRYLGVHCQQSHAVGSAYPQRSRLIGRSMWRTASSGAEAEETAPSALAAVRALDSCRSANTSAPSAMVSPVLVARNAGLA